MKCHSCNNNNYWRFYVIIKLSYRVFKGLWTFCFFSFCYWGLKIGIFPIELFNGKSMGNKSSITKSSIFIMGNSIK